MSNPMIELESQLRQSADAVRVMPSRSLRKRTVSRLQEMPFAADSARRRSSHWALAAYAMLMAMTLSYAYVQFPPSPHAKTIAINPAKSSAPLKWSSLSKWSVPAVQMAMAQPYKDEWDSLSRDAERTIDRVRQEIARLPRFGATMLAPNEPDSDGADLR